jgi:hypothetical protein
MNCLKGHNEQGGPEKETTQRKTQDWIKQKKES